jgi:hypothetical protein
VGRASPEEFSSAGLRGPAIFTAIVPRPQSCTTTFPQIGVLLDRPSATGGLPLRLAQSKTAVAHGPPGRIQQRERRAYEAQSTRSNRGPLRLRRARQRAEPAVPQLHDDSRHDQHDSRYGAWEHDEPEHTHVADHANDSRNNAQRARHTARDNESVAEWNDERYERDEWSDQHSIASEHDAGDDDQRNQRDDTSIKPHTASAVMQRAAGRQRYGAAPGGFLILPVQRDSPCKYAQTIFQ